MNFKKLALASAIAAMPVGAFALDEIADEALSDVTGQDGIEMEFGTTADLTASIYLHDTDGLGGTFGATFTGSSAYSFDGAIVMQNMVLMSANSTVFIRIDAGDRVSTTTGAPVLNINIALPTLSIQTGNLFVANSQRDAAVPGWSIDTLSSTILNNMTIVIGSTSLNIQLGNEAQTGFSAGSDMIVFNAQIANGITLNNFRLNDATASGDGGIGMTSMALTNTGGGNLDAYLDINATDAGLVVGIGRLGGTGGTAGIELRITGQYLGSTSAGTVGDITVSGLNLNGSTLTISGK